MHDNTEGPLPIPETLSFTQTAADVMCRLFSACRIITSNNLEHDVHQHIRGILQYDLEVSHNKSPTHSRALATKCAQLEKKTAQVEFDYIITTIQFMVQVER